MLPPPQRPSPLPAPLPRAVVVELVGGCWLVCAGLKSSDAGRKYFKGRTSFRCGTDPPTPVPTPNITEIHVVTSNHFDGGCKIGGCNNVSTAMDFMWPLGCAITMHGPGQPHAYHVINRYFDVYFPLAASLGDKFRALGGTDKYIWMTQSWIISLFLNCESAHYNAWDNSGRNLLHCPNETAVDRFKRAVTLGDITWHAAATDQEAEFFPNVGLFNASMELSDELAEQLGVERPISVSTRDVPFWSRAALPLLAARGIIGMSFGSGGPPGRPYGVPPMFVWRDIASGAEAVVTSESGYGGIGTEFVLSNGVALAVDWTVSVNQQSLRQLCLGAAGSWWMCQTTRASFSVCPFRPIALLPSRLKHCRDSRATTPDHAIRPQPSQHCGLNIPTQRSTCRPLMRSLPRQTNQRTRCICRWSQQKSAMLGFMGYLPQ